MASIEIKWDGLAQVAGISLAFAVGVAIVFTVGVLGLSRAEARQDETGTTTGEAPPGRAAGLAIAGVAFAACAAAVLYGLYLLIPQFH